MSIKRFLLSVSVFMLIGSFSYSQDWKLEMDKDGVKVYTRPVKGSNIKEFRGEITVKSNMGSILAIIDSVPEYTRWMYKCSYAERLKKINRISGYVYSVLASPWPLTDRDMCTYYNVTQDTNTRIVTISIKGVKDYIPSKPDKVRIPSIKGYWQLIPVSKGITKVVYQVHSESGGSVPASIVNMYITDTPYYNLINLKKIVESPLLPKVYMKDVKEI